MANQTTSADDIQREMQQVRTELRASAVELADSAREMTVWQRYVQSYPWACLGAAALVGYLIVPARARIVQPSAAQMNDLAAQLKAPLGHDKPRAGLLSSAVSGVAGMALNGLLQTGLSLASHHLNRYLQESLAPVSPQPGGSDNGEASNHV